MHFSLFACAGFASAWAANLVNFPFEATQLEKEDINGFPAIGFGDNSAVSMRRDRPRCKAFPGTDDWPTAHEWSRLNDSMNGVLLKPIPAASACYDGVGHNSTQCDFLLTGASETRFYTDDPLTVLTQWPQGDTCLAAMDAHGNCTQGGFPVYVANVTTVRDIQAAVNFARNMNVRLVIKNTGHDFLGRNTGAGSLSIWTHYLKSFELLPNYTQGEYTGMAARVGAGLETWEVYNLMDLHNITLIVPLTMTVGPYGGFTTGGGHSTFASFYGLGSDQVLSLQVVTADGDFVTADTETNRDLFYALRGGGGSTFGVVTSAIVKAHPSINVTIASLSFATRGGNGSAAFNETARFWKGINTYYAFGKSIVDQGGMDRSYLEPAGSGFSFSTQIEMPNMTVAEASALLQPLLDSLNKTGVDFYSPPPDTGIYGTPQTGLGAMPANSRFASRLFPRANWEDENLFTTTMQAIRRAVEAGYTFHGLFMGPSKRVAGYPGQHSAVNPAFRTTVMHADIFDFASPVGEPEVVNAAHERLNTYMEPIRAATKGSGAYTNEADVQEPNWQESFWGSNYPRLREIKNDWDPLGVFWAPSTVGSEDWEVRTADGLPTQNGKLCRVM